MGATSTAVSSLTGGAGPLSYLLSASSVTGVASALDPAVRAQVSEGNLGEAANLASYHLPLFGAGRRICEAAQAGNNVALLLNSGLLIAEGAGLKWERSPHG